MITFFNRLLAKGGSWVMTILLAVLVVAFVFTVGNAPGISGREQALSNYNYYGVTVSRDSKEWRDLSIRGAIQAEMQYASLRNNPQFARFIGQIIDSTAMNNARQNLPLNLLAEKVGIPDPTKEEIQEYIKDQDLFKDTPPPANQFSPPAASGSFKQEKLTDYLDRLKARGNEEAFFDAVTEALRLDELRSAINGPGRALPFEAEAKIRTDETLWSVELAILEKATGKDAPESPEGTDEQLNTLYGETQDQYAPEERRKVSYLVFPAKYSHPTTAQLEEYYKKHHKRYTEEADDKKEDGKDDKEGEKKEDTPAKAYSDLDFFTRDDVLTDFKHDNQLVAPALKTAQARADSILDLIYNDAEPLSREETDKLLQDNKITPRTHLPRFNEPAYPKKQLIDALNAPFVHRKPSDDENSQAEKLLKLAFSTLTAERYYTEPFKIGDNYVILLLDQVFESVPPSFDELKKNPAQLSKLKRQWKDQNDEEIFSKKREEIEKSLQAGLDAKKTLQDTITSTDAGKGWILAHKTHENFKSTKLPEGLPQTVFDSVQELAKGTSSAMVSEGGKAYLLVLSGKLVPNYTVNDDKVKTELARLDRSGGDSVAGELVARGRAKMKIDPWATPEERESSDSIK